MPGTVFYAWQSDLPNNTNRGFIERCLERAIQQLNADLGVEVAQRTKNTEGVPGTATVADAIFRKIDASQVFVADITPLKVVDLERPMPNPNVVIEYGRATGTITEARVLQVFNAAFGDPIKDRPFDLQHKSAPISYFLPKEHTEDQRAAAKMALVGGLRDAIALILREAPTRSTAPPTDAWSPMRERYFQLLGAGRERGNRMIGFWIGLIPTDPATKLERPWDLKGNFKRQKGTTARIGHDRVTVRTLDASLDPFEPRTVPVLGGLEHEYLLKVYPPNTHREQYDASLVSVHEDGRILVASKTTLLNPKPGLCVDWIMADVVNGLRIVDDVRGAYGAAHLRYWLCVELRYDDYLSQELPRPVATGDWLLFPLGDEAFTSGPTVAAKPAQIGPIEVGQRDSYPSLLGDIFERLHLLARREPKTKAIFDDV